MVTTVVGFVARVILEREKGSVSNQPSYCVFGVHEQ